jgi:hypothetical protein
LKFNIKGKIADFQPDAPRRHPAFAAFGPGVDC